MRHCSTCGWSNEQKQRCCLKCEGPVVLNNGMNSAAGGGGGLLGAVMAWFFGLALSLTLLFGVAFALTLAGVFTMGFKCNMCGWTAADNLLSKQEKEEKGGKRFKMILGSAACGVLAVACFAWWAWAMKSRLNGS
jgi:hypothetical protein